MSGVLRLGNTGAGTGRSTLVAAASNDQTFTLPSAGGTLLTSNYIHPRWNDYPGWSRQLILLTVI